MKYDSKKLIKIMVFASIVSFVIISVVLIFVFSSETVKSYNNSLREIAIQNNKSARIAAQDNINKIINFVTIYKNSLYKRRKQEVQNKVKDAIEIIHNVYFSNLDLSNIEILKKIKKKLRDKRFFNNKTGYYFIYTLQGKCILLPILPSLEGTNQINLQDIKKNYTIKRTIKLAKDKNEGFLTWWWYKENRENMKEKIGYIKVFKPLDIYIGTAVYKEDILKNVKQKVMDYLQKINRNEYGYIFAYDFSGNKMLNKGRELVKINRWYDAVEENRFIRDAIRGARVLPEGFFKNYISKKKDMEFAYIRLVPDLNLVLGAKVENTKKIYNRQKKSLKNKIDTVIKDTTLIAVSILLLISLIFIFLSQKVIKLFVKLEENIELGNQEINEQKSSFKALFENAPFGVLLTKDKKPYNCNNKALKIFKAEKKEELLMQEPKAFFPARQSNNRDSYAFFRDNMDLLKSEKFVEFEIEALSLKGDKIWINIVATTLKIKNETINYLSFGDITTRKKIEYDFDIQQQKLLFQSKHDALTSLPNRVLLIDRLKQSIIRADRSGNYVGVIFLDIDNFKTVNDLLGHDIGDFLLIEVALILQNFTRSTDIISRFGGDEFVLILDKLTNISDCSKILQKIMVRFQEPFILQNIPLEITFSMGVSIYPNDAKNEQSLLKFADMAMYKAKENGKNRYVYYDQSMNVDMLEYIKLEQDIKRGIENDEFILHFQPQVEAISQRIVGFEALVRWQHPKLGLKYPDYFIQTAENSNLIISLGEAISKKAIEQISLWYKDGLNPGIVSINFTSKQLESENFFDILADLMRNYDCKPEWIEGELIERYIMSDTTKTTQMLKCFKDIGVSIAIDDFGTGYSSLGYLKYLEISKLKIDKIFVDDLQKDKRDRAIAKSIIDLSSGLGLKVIAEGVETKEQYEILQLLGCQIIQGYYFSKPLTSDDAKNLLLKKQQETLRLPR